MRIKPCDVEDVRDVKQIKKILPYSVTEIGDKAELKAWKAEQERKTAEWEAGKAERYAEAKERAVNVILNVDKPSEDVNARADKAYNELKTKKFDKPATQIKHKPEEKSLFNKIVDKFLDIKFDLK